MKILKWLGILAGGVLGLAVMAVAIVYVVVGRDLTKTFDIELPEANFSIQAVNLEEAQRLARTRGCFGCHGENGAGTVFFEVFDATKLVAPDLGLAAKKYSTAELDNIIRHGMRPDGSSVVRFMPSTMYQYLSDEDAGLIIAYVQTLAPAETRLPETWLGPVARLMLLGFKRSNDTFLAAEAVDHKSPGLDISSGDPAYLGKYLAMTSCSECHGDDLGGTNMGAIVTPPLTMIRAYSLEDFTTLMRTGVPLGGRKFDLMAKVAVERFSHFTEEEIAALHAYLTSMGAPGT